jgi:hypothetical protein
VVSGGWIDTRHSASPGPQVGLLRKAPCAKSRNVICARRGEGGSPGARPQERALGNGSRAASAHVFPERERGASTEGLRDVHAGGVHLVEEGEALRPIQAALLELHHDRALAQQDHLLVVLVEVDDPRHVRQPVLEQRRCHLQA